MDVVAAVCTDEETAAVVEPGEGALDDPALCSEARAVFGLAASDDQFDPSLPDETAVFVVVVAAVSDQGPRPAAWPSGPASDGWHPLEQFDKLGDIVAVAAGERPGERDPAAVYEEMVLAARAASIDGARTRFRAPFFACR